MTSFSKISFFLIPVSFILFLSSCNKSKNDVIPDVYVDFTIDLNDPEFLNLIAMGGTVTVDRNTNNFGLSAAGFSGNGIIIYAGVDEFFAYDRTCPHDYALNVQAIKINIDGTNSLYAICPQCSTKYMLPANGTPAEGIGRYPLKNYRTSLNGRWLRVWNDY